MRNIALKLMYNGTAYHGWQVQKTVSSVCETMEKGLSKVCGGNVKLVGCGRTDAGVHAERYIANFHTESRIPVERLPFAINTHTPEDIVVREALRWRTISTRSSRVKKRNTPTASIIRASRTRFM